MIFVTVSGWPFERLIKAMDELAGSSKLKEKVIMQIGNTKYEPKNCEWFRFESFERIFRLNKTARVIVAHAGAGCIITALRFKKPLVVAPRYKKFREHTDDHQRDLAEMLDNEKVAIPVYDVKDIEYALKRAKEPKIRKEKARLISNLKRYLQG